MKILITGGRGFIGQHLAEAFRKQRDEVFLLKRDQLTNINSLTADIKKISPDYIFHLASYGNHYNQTDEAEMVHTNILKLFRLLKASKDIDYKAFINFSTSSVQLDYETMYSATKKAGEHICKAFAQKYNKPVISVRPASVFGEDEASFRFIPTIISSLRSGSQMDLDINASHSWIYVGDLVNAVLYISRNITKVRQGEAINVSYGEKWRNLEIATLLEQISGKTLRYKEAVNMRPYDNKEWLVDNKKLLIMGWRHNYGLIKGLTKTYKWYMYGNKT